MVAKKSKGMFVREENGVVVVDADIMYPHYLKIVEAAGITKQNLELARRVFTRDLKEVLGPPLHVKIGKGERNWSLRSVPDGGEDKVFFPVYYRSLKGTPAQRLGIVE